eukprot:213271_1
MIFRLLLLLIICIDNINVASGMKWSIKCVFEDCCFFHCGNKRETQPPKQRSLHSPEKSTTKTEKNPDGLVSFDLKQVDAMSSVPESVGSELESTTTSAITERQTSFQPPSVSMNSLSFSKKYTKRFGSRNLSRLITNPLIPVTKQDSLFFGIPASNEKLIVDYCKTMITIFPLDQHSKLLTKTCWERFVELLNMHTVKQLKSQDIIISDIIDDAGTENPNNSVIALDLSSIVSTYGELELATERPLNAVLREFSLVNSMSHNMKMYSVVQRNATAGVYTLHSYRNHFLQFMDTVRGDTVGVYVNLNVNNSGSILAHLYHVVALEMIYNHAQSGTPFEFAFVSFPAADEQHAHAIFHVLSAWPQRFWSSATRLMIVDSNGDKAWDVITPEELDEELRCKKMRLRNFVPILAKQAPSFRLAHDPSILVVTASRIKLDLIRGTFEQIANDNFWLHAQMMGEVLTGGYRRPWLHNSVAKVISWTDTEMGGDLTTV